MADLKRAPCSCAPQSIRLKHAALGLKRAITDGRLPRCLTVARGYPRILPRYENFRVKSHQIHIEIIGVASPRFEPAPASTGATGNLRRFALRFAMVGKMHKFPAQTALLRSSRIRRLRVTTVVQRA
jgi:hypothetical protein